MANTKRSNSENKIGVGVDGVGGVAEPITEQDTEIEFTDTDGDETGEGSETDKTATVGKGKGGGQADAGEGKDADERRDGTPGTGDKTRDRKRDAEAARLRREAERKADVDKAKVEADTAAVIEALGGKNPYTGDEMTDAEDVKAWRTMRRIEQSGGDPVKDFARETATEERQRAAAEQGRIKAEGDVQKEINAFAEAYPDVKPDELFADADFMAYADGKLGRMSLSEVYGGYKRIADRYAESTKKAEDGAVQRAAQAIANGMASPGSATGESGEVDTDYLTEDQVRAMTPRQVAENYDRVWRSQQRWNAKK